MKLQWKEWTPDNSRMDSIHRMWIQLKDADTGVSTWFEKKKLLEMLKIEDVPNSEKEELSKFIKKLDIIEKSMLRQRDLSEGFHRNVLEKMVGDDGIYIGEIQTTHYTAKDSESEPLYQQLIKNDDFNFNTASIGIDKKILRKINEKGIIDVQFCDDYAPISFYTQAKKFKAFGSENEENGKVYLSIRHFDVIDNRDPEHFKPSRYDKYIKRK